jgi:hypothetical protein
MDAQAQKLEKETAQKKAMKAKKSRITKEEKRLRESYGNIPDNQMGNADGLIRRAAHMRVTLEDYEKDIDENGYVEMFSQSKDATPYERGRPVVQFYNSTNKNYQSIIKQLSDLMPKDGLRKKDDEDDGFDSFVDKK